MHAHTFLAVFKTPTCVILNLSGKAPVDMEVLIGCVLHQAAVLASFLSGNSTFGTLCLFRLQHWKSDASRCACCVLHLTAPRASKNVISRVTAEASSGFWNYQSDKGHCTDAPDVLIFKPLPQVDPGMLFVSIVFNIVGVFFTFRPPNPDDQPRIKTRHLGILPENYLDRIQSHFLEHYLNKCLKVANICLT